MPNCAQKKDSPLASDSEAKGQREKKGERKEKSEKLRVGRASGRVELPCSSRGHVGLARGRAQREYQSVKKGRGKKGKKREKGGKKEKVIKIQAFIFFISIPYLTEECRS